MQQTIRRKLVIYSVLLILTTTVTSTIGAAFLNFTQTRRQNQERLENALTSFEKDFAQMMSTVDQRFEAFTANSERTSRFMAAVLFDPSTQDLPLEVGDLSKGLNAEYAAFYFRDGGDGPERLRYYYSRELGGIVMINYIGEEGEHALLVKDAQGFATQETVADAKLFPSVYEPSARHHALQVKNGKLLLVSYFEYINNSFEDLSIDVRKGAHVGYFILEKQLDVGLDELDRRMGVNFNLYDAEGKRGGGKVPMPHLNPQEMSLQGKAELKLLTDTQGALYDALVIPLQKGSEVVGYASIAISQRETIRKITETVIVLALISLAVLVATLFGSLVLVRSFSEPLVKLAQLFSQIAEVCKVSAASLGEQLAKIRPEAIHATTQEMHALQDSFLQMLKVIEEQTHVIEEQNRTLEQKVHERTTQLRQKTIDIQNMLENMHQGIFTILPESRVHREYSIYLEKILETNAIADAHVMPLLFGRSNLGEDQLNQLEVALSALLGEDLMMFQFNQHALIREFQKVMHDGRVKILELEWDPIANDHDVIEKIMVTVRDVTELRGLQAEAEQQKRELEIIGQILSVSQQKFQEFLKTSHHYLEENAKLIQQTESKDPEVIATLFRNMHTIKGNARTYGFNYLTNAVHQAENSYDQLRRSQELAWDKDKLINELQSAEKYIEQYQTVYQSKLGGFSQAQGVLISSSLWEKIQQATQKIPSSPEETLAIHQKLQRYLKAIDTEELDYVLEGILKAMPSLAQELGKKAPQIQIISHDLRIQNEIAPVLKDVFMHTFRNSMDHGIEMPEERQAAGKPAAGQITLEANLEGEKLVFRFQDDGRGLGLARIRQKALEQGLAPQDRPFSDEETAELIFQSGLSTAQTVSEISGRGVGMDAVRRFMERHGGQIAVQFTGPAVSTGYRPFQLVISLPGHLAMRIEAI